MPEAFAKELSKDQTVWMACQTVWLSCQTVWPPCKASWPNLNWPNSTQNGCRNLGFWKWHYSKFWWFQRLFENLATNSIFSYFLHFEVKKQQCKKVNYIFKCPLQYFFQNLHPCNSVELNSSKLHLYVGAETWDLGSDTPGNFDDD